MKYGIISATIRSDKYVNTGYIHISKSFIEGCFSLDYAKLSIVDKNLVLFLEEFDTYDFRFCDMIKSSTKDSNIECISPHQMYTLYYENNKVIRLETFDFVTDKYKISNIKAEISQMRR